tara:strand:+ start:816 stop:1040 length:225 start_codon:yes stop_codon:yes gene_type:complete
MMKEIVKVVKRSRFICTSCGGKIPSSMESMKGHPDLVAMGLCLRCYVHIIFTDNGYTWDDVNKVWYKEIEGPGQ